MPLYANIHQSSRYVDERHVRPFVVELVDVEGAFFWDAPGAKRYKTSDLEFFINDEDGGFLPYQPFDMAELLRSAIERELSHVRSMIANENVSELSNLFPVGDSPDFQRMTLVASLIRERPICAHCRHFFN